VTIFAKGDSEMKLNQIATFLTGLSVSITAIAEPYLIDLDSSKISSEASLVSEFDSASLKDRQLLALSRTIKKLNLPVDIIAIRSGFEGEALGFSQIDSAIKYGISSLSDSPEEGFRPITLDLYVNNNKATCIANVQFYRNEPSKVALTLIRYCPEEIWETLGEAVIRDPKNAGVRAIRMENFSLLNPID
jgi:hypothetical protein